MKKQSFIPKEIVYVLAIAWMLAFLMILVSCSNNAMRYDSNSTKYKRQHGIQMNPPKTSNKPMYK